MQRSLLLFPLLLHAVSSSVTAADDACRRVKLSSPPAWTISGSWNGDYLLLVDALKSEILKYSLDGSLADKVTGSTKGFPADFRPSSIQEAKDGYFLLSETAKILKLSEDLSYLKEDKLIDQAKNRSGSLASVFDWSVAGTDLVSFSDIQRPNGSWEWAFLRVPLSSPASFRVVGTLGVDKDGRNFYLFGHPYLTSIDDRAYVLAMAPEPAIFLIPPGSGKPRKLQIPAFSRALQGRPVLPSKRGLETVKSLFEAVEHSSLITGIFGWRGSLYLLVREPAANGQTEWKLARINPRNGSVLYIAGLATSANHLTAVPGARYWAFVEKGEVQALGKQDIPSILLVPASQIENPAKPAAKEQARICE
jgi:hypothetical protein